LVAPKISVDPTLITFAFKDWAGPDGVELDFWHAESETANKDEGDSGLAEYTYSIYIDQWLHYNVLL